MTLLTVSIAVGAKAETFVEVPESPLPVTTAFARRRLTVSKDTECVTFRLSQTPESMLTEIYAIEYDVRSYTPDAEGV